MKKVIFVFVILLSFGSLNLSTAQKRIDFMQLNLNTNWTFRQADKKKWMPAKVPGTVHTDLLANGMIEDPFYRTNEKKQQWIDKKDWEYKTTFKVKDDLFSKKHIEIHFKGLDTYADVYLNGEQILSANNMFREWKADCKSLLNLGNNELKIYFHSPIKVDLPKLKELGYQLPAVNDQSENGGLGDQRISIFARKAGYHYGWDWGPRFVTSGIWRPVYLEGWDDARIVDLYMKQKGVTDKKAELTAQLEIIAADDFEGKLIISDENKEVFAAKKINLIQGKNKVDVHFDIKNPKLWWTNGLGESYLYHFQAQLKIDEKICDEREVKTGIRTIRVVREKEQQGKSFYFELNGVPVFAKGANYIPNDNFVPRVTAEKYNHIIKSAVDANMNMLRVWGGGIYENDIFYDLCDQYGILVWQDFMFACSMYPGDDEFLQNVKQEAIQNVKRLRNHPCIALWCGNNEIDAAWSHDTPGGWGWKERFSPEIRKKIWNDYEAIFHSILPDAVKKYDPGTFYWPSSPLADFGKRASYSNTSGDMHYWGVWHGKEPFENFKKVIPRFMSEYGFQSFPEFKTVKAYTVPEDWDINSEVMAAHQRSGIGNQRIKMYMEWDYHVPDDFQHLLYVGQVLQAEGMKIGMEAHRRAMPYCMGTLYWQLNDCWPVASWSGIDYYGRWKALHYFAKKAYQDVLVSPTIEGDSLNVFVISDRLESFDASLKLTLIDFSGNIIWQKISEIALPSNNSDSCFKIALSELLKNADKNEVVLRAVVGTDEKIISENQIYFDKVKHLELPKPEIKADIAETDDGYQIALSTDKLAKNVYLSTKEIAGFFSDNYFDLFPGEVKLIEFKCDSKSVKIKDELKIISLRDSY